jgi:hypothetical protein
MIYKKTKHIKTISTVSTETGTRGHIVPVEVWHQYCTVQGDDDDDDDDVFAAAPSAKRQTTNDLCPSSFLNHSF